MSVAPAAGPPPVRVTQANVLRGSSEQLNTELLARSLSHTHASARAQVDNFLASRAGAAAGVASTPPRGQRVAVAATETVVSSFGTPHLTRTDSAYGTRGDARPAHLKRAFADSGPASASSSGAGSFFALSDAGSRRDSRGALGGGHGEASGDGCNSGALKRSGSALRFVSRASCSDGTVHQVDFSSDKRKLRQIERARVAFEARRAAWPFWYRTLNAMFACHAEPPGLDDLHESDGNETLKKLY